VFEELPLRSALSGLQQRVQDQLKGRSSQDGGEALAQTQQVIARDHGFGHWRALLEHVAASQRNLDAIVPPQFVERAQQDAIAPDDPDRSAFFQAVDQGRTTQVAALLHQKPALVRIRDQTGKTPLHLAVQRNDPRIATLLVAYGAPPEARFGPGGHTALSWAVTCHALECAMALVRLGVLSDLFCAAGMGDRDRLGGFFDSRGNLSPGASRTGSTRLSRDGKALPCPPSEEIERVSDALCMACRNGQVGAVEFLLTKKPDLSFRGFLGATPLHWAHYSGNRNVIDRLAQAGADDTLRDTTLGTIPRAFGLFAPASWGFEFLVRKQLDHDPTLAILVDGGTSALHEAAKSGSLNTVKLLLRHGASTSLRDGQGRLPLDWAREKGHAHLKSVLHPGVS